MRGKIRFDKHRERHAEPSFYAPRSAPGQGKTTTTTNFFNDCLPLPSLLQHLSGSLRHEEAEGGGGAGTHPIIRERQKMKLGNYEEGEVRATPTTKCGTFHQPMRMREHAIAAFGNGPHSIIDRLRSDDIQAAIRIARAHSSVPSKKGVLAHYERTPPSISGGTSKLEEA
ncbi:unnamed protein product [Larinioides sclopetarius]|uniref:Uncharacterized protein n=1 Tax=Larinioides sclopetarius TaxID=280406 RepID=A0AAV2ALI8_9ARAC